ncbi:MAG: GNAT family N-acetyltransferase [Gemmatimonadota bacterium]|nr:GNAT family N-acetyltransferase [Gemmatimonadota bacterium]
MSQPPIHDNAEAGRFTIESDGEMAYLEYARGPEVLALVHTEVPRALRGRGFAGRLAKHAAELARREGLRIEPSCPFQIGWLDRHTEYADLVHRPTGSAGEDPFWE